MKENIGAWLTKRAFLNPGMEAFVDLASGRRFTFADINKRSNRVADTALRAGLNPGDRVGILMMNGPEYCEALFGLAKVGIVVVPLNWRLTVPELTFILKDSGVSLLLYGSEFAETAKSLSELETGATNIKLWMELNRGGKGAPAAVDYDEAIAAASDREPEIVGSHNDLLHIMYTSGTTGLPKGVMHSHDTQAGSARATWMTLDALHGDRMLTMLPMFHAGALFKVIGAVYRGYSLAMMKSFDPVQFWEVLTTEHITTSGAVPAMLNAMMQVPAAQTTDTSRLRYLMSGVLRCRLA